MAANDAPRAAGRPAGRLDLGTTYVHKCSTARDRARLLVVPDGSYWIVAEDTDSERELRDLGVRLALVLVAHLGAA